MNNGSNLNMHTDNEHSCLVYIKAKFILHSMAVSLAVKNGDIS